MHKFQSFDINWQCKIPSAQFAEKSPWQYYRNSKVRKSEVDSTTYLIHSTKLSIPLKSIVRFTSVLERQEYRQENCFSATILCCQANFQKSSLMFWNRVAQMKINPSLQFFQKMPYNVSRKTWVHGKKGPLTEKKIRRKPYFVNRYLQYLFWQRNKRRKY